MIRDWVIDLLTLADEDWARYAFSLDPLIGKVSPPQRAEHHQKTVANAVELARGLREEHGPGSPADYAAQLGVNLVFRSEDPGDGLRMFASYEEPDTITVFVENAGAADRLIAEKGLSALLGDVPAVDVLVAHELYHFLEWKIPGVYSAQKHLSLWKIGPLENRSRILCLEEIGAMAFAQALTGLRCPAYIFEVILLYAQNPRKAEALYRHFMNLKSTGKAPA